jgi:glycosyltransferase involved in cell wall biosynthesis
MDISVIVPVYNSSALLGQCCDALLSQDYPRPRYEILMVDNGSLDDSARIVLGFGGIRLLLEPQKGSYAARNRGLRHARGRIIAFTDADCAPCADWLARIASAMDVDRVQVALGNRLYALDEGLMGMLAAYESRMAACTFAGSRPEKYYAYTNNMAIRKTVFDRIGDFELVQRGGDNLFLRRALATLGGCEIVHYDSEMLVRHLEIVGVSDYLKKKEIYGRVRACFRDREMPEPLPLLTRLDMAKRTLTGHSSSEAVRFCAVLAAGMVGFEWAAAVDVISRARKRFQ